MTHDERLAALVEKYKHIWEDELDNHVIVEAQRNGKTYMLYIYRLHGDSFYRFSNGDAEDVVFGNLKKAGVQIVEVEDEIMFEHLRNGNTTWLYDLLGKGGEDDQ